MGSKSWEMVDTISQEFTIGFEFLGDGRQQFILGLNSWEMVDTISQELTSGFEFLGGG